jgi:fructose-1,6-bisphosphatase/inositol monophosphatase family enzyme
MLPNPQSIVDHLRQLQRLIRQALIDGRSRPNLEQVNRATAADTIYQLDVLIEPVVEEYCDRWGREIPLVLIAEGIEPETGRVFPHGTRQEDAPLRVIIDPVDGTRGIMYDKRPAWALAGVAANKGSATRLSDIEVAVMTELPTSKMGWSDVLWAVRGQGAHALRDDLRTGQSDTLPIRPSQAQSIAHGFAMVSNFFPGTKVMASELMERIASQLLGPADVTKAMVFEDQYISTGGQFYELIMGHDRFNADLRPLFYQCNRNPEGLCCHPYDCATLLIAQEAGIAITNGLGRPLDGPLDTTTGLSWAGYANPTLRGQIEPIVRQFFRDHGIDP